MAMEMYENLLATLGNTPLVKLRRFHPEGALLAGKIEAANPGGSVKDRIGIAMIEAAERDGRLKPGGTIVEPTSGNTGMGLAMAANLKGYKLVCVTTSKVPKEKVTLLESMGAEVVVCPVDVEPEDPRSYYRTAERLEAEREAFRPNQYDNQANPEAHYRTTGPEIWRQTGGKITHWVTGMGTGGTISGTAKYLKEQNPDVRVIGVDTVGSVYTHYRQHGEFPPAEQIHGYLIDGIGEDFLPTAVWWDYIDEVIAVDDQSAYKAIFELSQKESIFTGSSGGAAAVGARRVAESLPDDALVVTLFPDSGERYLSKLSEEWMGPRGLLD
jgi:cystathionine beta-synthase